MASKSLTSIVKLEGNNSVSRFSLLFILTGIITQILAYKIGDDTILSLFSGIMGIISVVLCSQKKISFYLFGFVQLFTYVILCVHERLYGEIVENAFYFVTMLFGIYHWLTNYNEEKIAVETRSMSLANNILVFCGTVVLTVLLCVFLMKTNDSQPLMDAITTVPAFVAQVLLIYRIKESWIYWFIIDVGAIFMWGIADNWCMVLQYIFWTINCIYGFFKWNE